MNLFSLRAPQLGEGIKSVVVTSFLKKEGDSVCKDEPILLVETRKAAMEIESPVSGVINKFMVPLDEEIQVGTELLNIRIEDEIKLIVGDQDKHLKKSPKKTIGHAIDPIRNQEYDEQAVSTQQYILIKAMRSSGRHIIPAFIQQSIGVNSVQDLRKQFRTSSAPVNQIPSSTEIFAWCVLQSMKQNHRFRSLMLDDDKTIQKYEKGSIGIAVGLPNDELTTVKIAEDEYNDFSTFVGLCKKRIAEAKSGFDHNGSHFVTVSDLCALGVEASIPVVVSPAVATLAIGMDGTSREQEKRFILSLTFDHRLINGAGAAAFLSDIRKAMDTIKSHYT